MENGPELDRLAKVVIGTNYGWGKDKANWGKASDENMKINTIYNWVGAAPANIAFIQPETFNGSGFPPDKIDHAFVTESGPAYATVIIFCVLANLQNLVKELVNLYLMIRAI